ncbi:MAG: transporter substrate-binding domain-containing protein [Oleiphilaceae bacterium]|nr:transporter substrate-binding domain-containing protein [Oleiphilaceae bacterium]
MISATAAAQAVTIATPPLTHLVDGEGSGVYERLLDRALPRVDMAATTVFYPYRRSLQAFERHDVDCLLSLTDVLLERFEPDKLAFSYPLGKFRFHIFTLRDDEAIHNAGELVEKNVGIIMGHEAYLSRVLPGGLSLQSVRSDALAVQMLKMGRLDAIIAALPDIQPFTSELNYSQEHPLLSGFDRLNCHNTARNRHFLEALSGVLMELKREGVYEEVAGELYVPFSEDELPDLRSH